MISHWCLRESKSPLVSRTLLSILADLKNTVVRMVSTRSLISKTSSPCINPLVRAPITIGITITFMFHSFFNFIARFRYFSFFSLSFSFTLWSAETAKSTNLRVLFFFLFFFSFFFLIIRRSGRLAEIRWFVCISKPQRSLCVLFSKTDSGLCVYHLFGWSISIIIIIVIINSYSISNRFITFDWYY